MKTNNHKSLADAIVSEQSRVRELKETYLSIGPAGIPASLIMEASLKRADKAVMSGDVVEMIKAYEDLKGFSK